MGNFRPRDLLRALVLAATLFCWVRALILSGDMVKSASPVSFRYGTDGIPRSAANRMLDDDASFAAWVQKNNQHVTEQEFSRGIDLQVLEIAGDPELVLPPEKLLYGFLPVRGSMDTCTIDVATSYTLCGSTDAIGEILIYDDREYTVIGVFSLPENTMLLQNSLEEDISFSYLELSTSSTAAPRQQANEFMARYSLPEPDMLIDNMESAAIFRQLALFPAVILSTLLLWRVLCRIFGKPDSFLKRIGFAVAMAAGVYISVRAIGFSPVIPAVAIPGRWSDFSFWSALPEEIAKQAGLSRTLGRPSPDMLRLQGQYSVLFYSCGALAGFVIGILWKPGS